MTWKVNYDPRAVKELAELDKPIRRRIVDYLGAVAASGDPASRGKALTGNLVGLGRYRVSDYRVICQHQHAIMVVLVVEVGHRSEVYG